ncbi:hypothetical protein LA080_013847 [Diaporthe eres]|nr:hypothetical protein LA080_013847 [Diaporthe eres]
MDSATTGFEESLAALRLDEVSKPRINMRWTYAEGWTIHTLAVADTEGKIEPQPRSKPDTTDIQREHIQSPELPRFDSTSSMRSLMTDSIFSIGNTTDSFPPSPSSSAHVTESLQCESWDLNSYRVLDTSHRVNAWSTLRTGGQKSSMFTDDDGEQSRSVRDDPYDLLIEAICNVVSDHFTENELRKLNAPITHYANVFLEHITRDIGDSNTLSTTPVIYQTHGSSEDASTASITRISSSDNTVGREGKRESRSEQNDSDEDDTDDAGSRPPTRMDGYSASQKIRANEGGLSCPFRKRNPMRFNIRSHSSCALSDFPSMMHLKRHIKAFHSKSGEGCRHCGAWFRTIEDLNQHVAQPLLCEPGHAANRNPEDGISQTDLQTLFDKKVQTWHDMWLIIFPDLDRDLPYPEFDPPVELDEVETQFYGPDSFDNLSHTFQQIALHHPRLSPGQLSQRALNELVAFIVSTLQRCRDLQSHTASLIREARRQEFVDRVQNLRLQASEVQSLGSTTPPRQILAPDNQVNPKYSRESHDSGIASFSESDIGVNVPGKPDQGCSNLSNAAFSPSRDVTPFRDQNHQFENISFENKVSEAHVSQWPRHYTSRLNVFGTEVDTYSCHEAHFSEVPAAWRACRVFYGSQQKYWDQQTHDHSLTEVDLESPSTQASPPSHSDSDPHFGIAKDDNNLAEDSEVQYEQLVENIANLVVKSNLIEYLEDDCMPIIQYTHAYLENIQNHDDKMETNRRPSIPPTTFCAAGDDSGPFMEIQDTPAGSNTNRKRKQGADSGNSRKRGDGDGEHPSRNDPEDLDDRDDWSGDKKRARIDDCQKFPCPYRKRNPTRFNVRKHPSCALNAFGSMALLKRHLKQFHLLATQGPQCGRCKRCFQTNEDFEEHCEQAIACEPRTGHDDLQDPEEGLSAKKYASLTKRGKDEKVNQWDAVWGVLFPEDLDVPSPGTQDYEEPVELDEVQERCYNEQSIAQFFQSFANHTHEDGFRYIVKNFKKIRKSFNHVYCDKRKQQDLGFLQAIRKRASSSHRLTFSHPPWGIQPEGISLLNDFNQSDSISPRIGSSGMYSLPDMTDANSSTGNSSNDARDNNHALTPPSSLQLAAATSDSPGTATLPNNVFGSSSEGSYSQQQGMAFGDSEIHSLQEQVSMPGYQLKSSYQQEDFTSGLCRHRVQIRIYCEQCADESPSLYGLEDFGTYSMGHVAGEDGGTLNQDQVIWSQTALDKHAGPDRDTAGSLSNSLDGLQPTTTGEPGHVLSVFLLSATGEYPASLDNGRKASIIGGLAGSHSSNSLFPTCSSGNCSFEAPGGFAYTTVGFGSECIDISPLIKQSGLLHWGHGLDANWADLETNYSLPHGRLLTALVQGYPVSKGIWDSTLSRSRAFNKTLDPGHIPKWLLDNVTMTERQRDIALNHAFDGLNFMMPTTSPCTYTLEDPDSVVGAHSNYNGSVSNGKLVEEPVGDPQPLDVRQPVVRMAGDQNDGDEGNFSWTYTFVKPCIIDNVTYTWTGENLADVPGGITALGNVTGPSRCLYGFNANWSMGLGVNWDGALSEIITGKPPFSDIDLSERCYLNSPDNHMVCPQAWWLNDIYNGGNASITSISAFMKRGFDSFTAQLRFIGTDWEGQPSAATGIVLEMANATAGATMAWAWATSRIMDALELIDIAESNIDVKRVGLTGCSRNGKGALVGGAFEPRLALTIPQESGSGGSATWRISDAMFAAGVVTQTAHEIIQENVWFGESFDPFVNDTALLPFDHHLLAALVAPHPILVLDNNGYDWLGPLSSYGGMSAARTVYDALGITSAFGFSLAASHPHCQFPADQQGAKLSSFLQRYLLNNMAFSTSVFDSATNGTEGNFTYVASDWITWTTPTLL